MVFQRGARGSWGDSEKNTMFHLLFTSLTVLGLSLLPLLLQPGFTESIWIWRICIPLLGAAHLLGASRAFFEHRRGETTLPPQAIHIFSFGSGLFFILTIAIATGFLLNIAPLAYFIGLGWMLAVAVLPCPFGRLISRANYQSIRHHGNCSFAGIIFPLESSIALSICSTSTLAGTCLKVLHQR